MISGHLILQFADLLDDGLALYEFILCNFLCWSIGICLQKEMQSMVFTRNLVPPREGQKKTEGKGVVIFIEKDSVLPLQFHMINHLSLYWFFGRKTKHVKGKILQP